VAGVACSCVDGILGSCPPLPDNQASARVRKSGGPGGDDTRTLLTRIRTSIVRDTYAAAAISGVLYLRMQNQVNV